MENKIKTDVSNLKIINNPEVLLCIYKTLYEMNKRTNIGLKKFSNE